MIFSANWRHILVYYIYHVFSNRLFQEFSRFKIEKSSIVGKRRLRSQDFYVKRSLRGLARDPSVEGTRRKGGPKLDQTLIINLTWPENPELSKFQFGEFQLGEFQLGKLWLKLESVPKLEKWGWFASTWMVQNDIGRSFELKWTARRNRSAKV